MCRGHLHRGCVYSHGQLGRAGVAQRIGRRDSNRRHAVLWDLTCRERRRPEARTVGGGHHRLAAPLQPDSGVCVRRTTHHNTCRCARRIHKIVGVDICNSHRARWRGIDHHVGTRRRLAGVAIGINAFDRYRVRARKRHAVTRKRGRPVAQTVDRCNLGAGTPGDHHAGSADGRTGQCHTRLNLGVVDVVCRSHCIDRGRRHSVCNHIDGQARATLQAQRHHDGVVGRIGQGVGVLCHRDIAQTEGDRACRIGSRGDVGIGGVTGIYRIPQLHALVRAYQTIQTKSREIGNVVDRANPIVKARWQIQQIQTRSDIVGILLAVRKGCSRSSGTCRTVRGVRRRHQHVVPIRAEARVGEASGRHT